MTKKVFVSLPMRDRSIDEIREDMNDILDMIKPGYAEVGEDVELIDSVWMDGPGPDIFNESVWYLGRSIQALAEADLAIFHPGWREARGCIIEHMVCAMYNIPYYDISMDYGNHEDEDVADYTHDWDLAGEINAELSKQVAEAEGLGEDDILDDEDVEDALGFEHDDVDDLIESDPDLNPYAFHKDSLIGKRIFGKQDNTDNQNPYVQHSEIDIAIMDEFDENGKLINSDILEPGEYNADVR